jgi:hypothetical protein
MRCDGCNSEILDGFYTCSACGRQQIDYEPSSPENICERCRRPVVTDDALPGCHVQFRPRTPEMTIEEWKASCRTWSIAIADCRAHAVTGDALYDLSDLRAKLAIATHVLRGVAVDPGEYALTVLAPLIMERDDLRAKLAAELRHPAAPDRCEECEWTNTRLLNYGEAGVSVWLCHGCAARRITRIAALEAERAWAVSAIGKIVAAMTGRDPLDTTSPEDAIEIATDLRAKLNRVTAERDSARKVAAYTRHTVVCDATRPWGVDSDGEWQSRGCPGICTCGLDAARKEAGL